MKLIAIEACKGRKLKLVFDDADALHVPEKEFAMLTLEVGDELDLQMYDRILEVLVYPQAKKKAMDLLVRQDHAEGELYQKLKQKGFPEKACEVAIAYVKSFHYLDDERFARNYIESRKQKKSRFELIMELRRKMVRDEIIEDAFSNLGIEDESETIRNLIQKKCSHGVEQLTWKDKQKLVAYLSRKGFSFDAINQVMDELVDMATK